MPLYPDFLAVKLSGDDHEDLRSAVDGTCAIRAWLKDSTLYFFPDYTEHGPDHLRQVLETASLLITKKARKHFTAKDAAVLILAVLLHDSAMHISKDGFYELIKGNASKRGIPYFDTVPWPKLWDEFLFMARRWDDRKLEDVFGGWGDDSPRPVVKNPFDHYHDLGDWDRKLIGEFIRVHHPRMAHEFALYGVPSGLAADPIRPDRRFGGRLSDLGGLVAEPRSASAYLHRVHERSELSPS